MTTIATASPNQLASSQQTPKRSVQPKPKKVAKAKVPKPKVKKAAAPSSHPPYNSVSDKRIFLIFQLFVQMVKKAIADLNDKKGSSRPAM